jgi:hypothetical protein
VFRASVVIVAGAPSSIIVDHRVEGALRQPMGELLEDRRIGHAADGGHRALFSEEASQGLQAVAIGREPPEEHERLDMASERQGAASGIGTPPDEPEPAAAPAYRELQEDFLAETSTPLIVYLLQMDAMHSPDWMRCDLAIDPAPSLSLQTDAMSGFATVTSPSFRRG